MTIVGKLRHSEIVGFDWVLHELVIVTFDERGETIEIHVLTHSHLPQIRVDSINAAPGLNDEQNQRFIKSWLAKWKPW